MELLERIPRAPLVTRLLAAITAVLAITLVVTFLVESNLSRSTLRAHAGVMLSQRADQARAILMGDIQPIHEELQFVGEAFRETPPGPLHADDRAALIRAINDVHARRPSFTSLGAYDRDGAPVVPPIGPVLEPPPPSVYDGETASFAGRVVPTTDGGLAYVSGELVGEAPNDVLVVFGYRFDRAYARTVRDGAGGSDVVLVVDGDAVASSLPVEPGDELLPTRRDDTGIQIVEVGGTTYWGEYASFAGPDDEWGSSGRLGVLIPDPLVTLDAALLRNRLWAGAALLVVATVLAWLVSRRLTRPLRELTETASRITGGDLDAPFPVTSDDEVGTLARALEEMRRGLGRQLELIERQTAALRDAAGRMVNAQDEARRRMAGDLHDGVQRQLVMLRLHIGFGRERIRQDPDQAPAVLDDLSAEIDDVLRRLRETAQGIYPSILRDRGLQGALFSLASRSRLPIEADVDPDPLPRLPHELEANTYFLVSEAVTNAVKHAQATRVVVRLQVLDHHLQVTVVDDGRGFDPEAEADGRGLETMRDRARALGGAFGLTSDAQGTVVSAALPLDPSVAGPLEEEQHGGDSTIDLEVLAQAQLLEDRVDVLLDRPVRDGQVASDPSVAPPGGHQGEDVELTRGEPGQS